MRVLACIASVICCVSAGAEPASRYVVRSATVTGLLTLDGYSSAAVDINDAGTIVGWTEVEPEVRHAFVLSGGLAEDIGAAIAPKRASEATAINAKGQVVGFYEPSSEKGDGYYSSQGFRWTGGVVAELGTRGSDDVEDRDPVCAPSARSSKAYSINDAGIVVGTVSCGWYSSVRWVVPAMAEFASWVPFIFEDIAFDINAANAVVGHAVEHSLPVIWRWESGFVSWQFIPLPPGMGVAAGHAVPDRPYIDDVPLSINDAGAVAGSLWVEKDRAPVRAFLWSGGEVPASDLGVLPGGVNSFGEDLNEERFVAGTADVPNIIGGAPLGMRYAGFIYHPDFGMHELPLLAPPDSKTRDRSCRAMAINERNVSSGLVQLVGWCYTHNGVKQAVRWDVVIQRVSVLPPGDRR